MYMQIYVPCYVPFPYTFAVCHCKVVLFCALVRSSYSLFILFLFRLPFPVSSTLVLIMCSAGCG
jgi:hypothetical protein